MRINLEDQMIRSDPDIAEAFSQRLMTALDTYHRFEIGLAGTTLWFNAMEGKCTLGEFTTAMNSYHMDGTPGYRPPMPTPGDILARLPGGTEEDRAWRMALTTVKHYGSSHSVSFEETKISGAIESMGGWTHFCRMFDTMREQDVRREFLAKFACQPVSAERRLMLGSYGEHSPKIEVKMNDGRLMVARAKLEQKQ